MSEPNRVRWTKANPDGWPGDGLAEVVKVEKDRPFFGVKHGEKGPAVLLRLVPSGHTVWVPPNEVEALT